MEGGVIFEGNSILSGALHVGTSANVVPLELEYDTNGTYTIEAPTGTDGYNPITIDVNVGEPNIQSLTATISGNGVVTYNASDLNVDGFDPVTIRTEVTPTLDDITITENGTYTPPTGTDGYNEINVNVPSLSLNTIADSLELQNEVNIVYNNGQYLELGKDYLVIATSNEGISTAWFTFNGSNRVFLTYSDRVDIIFSTGSCFWDWNSAGLTYLTINMFELTSPLLPVHE